MKQLLIDVAIATAPILILAEAQHPCKALLKKKRIDQSDCLRCMSLCETTSHENQRFLIVLHIFQTVKNSDFVQHKNREAPKEFNSSSKFTTGTRCV